jgi:DNA mismatch repair ATPase MutS
LEVINLSKLYNTYLALKKQDSQTIYLFKSGIFFIAIDDDARTLSNAFDFKLSNLNNDILKCGFPCSSFYKYHSLFQSHNFTVRIIEPDSNTLYGISEYKQRKDITELLDFINSIDIDNLSVSKAYQLIEDLKNKVSEINNMV